MGVFSYFPTTKPPMDFLESTKEVYDLTPIRWDPHDQAYANNEESLVNWEGNIIENLNSTQILLSQIDEDQMMADCIALDARVEEKVDRLLENDADGCVGAIEVEKNL